ncbi:hypothetical protein [Limimaricola hongkongensis]|uniref:Uncharacterized protein n=1 Tax=Limimaricola hongkongensis DSM 17492 TaxID=1122180 RepID=A0A017HH44_9RHOB|nr:hypothetical protein [Limimaricola hongkongensis]EYD73666.1 hypothetical protein Lokhon_00219 [Limimaricola hongkongensis DSM 17492]
MNGMIALPWGLGRLDRRLLLGFVALDLVLLAVGVRYGIAVARDPSAHWPDLLQFDHDWGLAEMANYLKWSIAAVALLLAWRRERAVLPAAIALTLCVAVLDDAGRLHERGGVILALASGLHARIGSLAFQLGELAVWAGLGLACAAPIWIGWRRAGATLRRRAIGLGACFAGVVLCAVGIDTLHVLAGLAWPDRPVLGGLFMIAEGGGENLFLSLLVAQAVGSFGRGGPGLSAPEPARP